MRIHPTLDLPEEEMRQLGYRIIDLLVDHFIGLPRQKTGAFATRPFLEKRLHESMPEYGAPPETILKKLNEDVLSYAMHLNHPRFFCFYSESQQLCQRHGGCAGGRIQHLFRELAGRLGPFEILEAYDNLKAKMEEFSSRSS